MPFGGALVSGVGSLLGGIFGASAADEQRRKAQEQQQQALEILQNIQNAPPQDRPLILQQYKQAGKLSPELMAAVEAGPSALEKIATSGEGMEAQKKALKQMQERAETGMTATDRAALAQAQQQAATEQNAKQQQILQQFAQRGQLGSGAQLAAQLAASQGGANQLSQAGLDIMGRSQQQALQAAAQAGGLGAQLEGQQFGEAAQKAQAADQMKRFNIQNQMAAQQQNVGAQNQAQAQNLANAQNIGNMNVQQANIEAARQRQGEQQNFQNQMALAQAKAGALTGAANQNLQQGQQAAQGMQNLFGGLGSAIGGGIGQMQSQANFNKLGRAKYGSDWDNYAEGGVVHDYRDGGHVSGKEVVPGDHPANDNVDAKLSAGEIVVNKELAQTSLGDKLIDLLKNYHELKSHVDKADSKVKKAQQKLYQGGPAGSAMEPKIPQDDQYMQNLMNQFYQRMNNSSQPMTAGEMINNQPIPPQSPETTKGYADGGPVTGAEDAMQFGNIYNKLKTNHPNLSDEALFQAAHAVQDKIKQQPVQPAMPVPAAPQQPEQSLGEKIGANMQMVANAPRPGLANGGMVPEKGTREYLEYLMGQYKAPKKSYADSTAMEEEGVVPEPNIVPVNFEEPAIVEGQIPKQEMEPSIQIEPNKKIDAKAKMAEADDEIEKAAAKDESEKDREPASEDSDKMEKDLKSESEEPSDKDLKEFQEPGKGMDLSNEALMRAQQERLNQLYGGQIQEGLALAGSGISRTDPSQIISSIRQQKDRAELPVKSFQELAKNQENDPSSNMSKAYRDAYKQILGKDANPNLSAADLKASFPLIEKYMQSQASAQSKKELKVMDLQNKLQIEQGRHEDRMLAAKDRAERQEETKRHNAEMEKIRSDMVALSGGRLGLSASKSIENDPTIKKSNDRINSADTAIGQLEDKSQPLTMNRLNAIQIDLANTLNFMASQGASDYKAKSDKLENLNTMIAGVKQKYGSNLVDLRREAPEVYHEVLAYANSVKDSISKIKDKREKELRKKYTASIGEESETSKRVNKAYEGEEKVTVEKDGKRYKLPRKQLDEAKKQGYVQVE